MKEQDVKTNASLVLINWTNEEGARFFPLLAVHVFMPDNQLSKKLTYLSRPTTPPQTWEPGWVKPVLPG